MLEDYKTIFVGFNGPDEHFACEVFISLSLVATADFTFVANCKQCMTCMAWQMMQMSH